METDKMWHRAMVKRFLADQQVSPETIEAAEARMAEFVREDGMFPAVGLKDALQDEVLEAAFIAAWNADPGPFMEVREQARRN